MKLADEIDEMDIEQVRSDFYALMNDIVTEYGDNQDGVNQQQTGQQTDPLQEEEQVVNV
jgi:hypothetical protein